MTITFEKRLNPIADKTNLGIVAAFLPSELPPIKNPQTDIPNIAKDQRLGGVSRGCVQAIRATVAWLFDDA